MTPRRRLGTAALFLVLALGTGLAAATSHFGSVPSRDHVRQNPFAGQPDAAAAGALLYRDHCAQCHQVDARGDRKRPSLRTPQVRAASDGDLEWFLRQGDLRHGMPSWSSLPQGQRWQIIAYLRSLP
ncbi:MAG TPA: cytochrome c [Terracidiphilus sp.]|jgi:mono/diheme cytochrome c family protein|nr:cytochrome c [Terracidiphilus sp.]